MKTKKRLNFAFDLRHTVWFTQRLGFQKILALAQHFRCEITPNLFVQT